MVRQVNNQAPTSGLALTHERKHAHIYIKHFGTTIPLQNITPFLLENHRLAMVEIAPNT